MLTIRKAIASDIPVLIDFQINLADESENVKLDRAIVQKGMQALFDDASKGQYYVAEEGGHVVGCHMVTFEWSDWRNGVVWWIQSVYVKKSHRQKGVFKKLYETLAAIVAKDPGIIGIRLYVDKNNERAMKVYTSMGMDGSHYTVYEWIKETD